MTLGTNSIEQIVFSAVNGGGKRLVLDYDFYGFVIYMVTIISYLAFSCMGLFNKLVAHHKGMQQLSN
jgi:hypothetical protein